jgi:hypothetical protein
MTDGEKSSKAVVTQRRSHACFERDERDGFIHRSWLKNQNYPDDTFGGSGGAVPGDLHWTRKRPSVSSMKSLALIATLVSSLFGASTSAVLPQIPMPIPNPPLPSGNGRERRRWAGTAGIRSARW